MRNRRHFAMLAAIFASLLPLLHAQAPASPAPAAANPALANPALANPAPAGKSVVLDRIVAVLNGDVLLESDVDEEMRFAAIEPYSVPPGQNSRQQAIERLINRTLIDQQRTQQPLPPIPDKDIDNRLAELRRQIPACARYRCTTDDGWHAFLADNHFTGQQVREHWRERMEVLRFIETRFRAGIRVPKRDIQEYYQKNLLPQFEKEKAKPPTLESVSPRIEEILLQQKVNQLLVDWLKSLRSQGSVQILNPADDPEAVPSAHTGQPQDNSQQAGHS